MASKDISPLKPKDLRALLDPQRALRKILNAAVRETNAKTGSFILINPNTGLLDIEAVSGLSERAKRLKLRLGEGITGWVASSGKPLRVGDVTREKRYVSLSKRIRAEMAVPVELEGQVVAVLNVDSNLPDAFTSEHEERLVRLASEAAEWLRTGWEIDQLRVKARQLALLVQMGQVIVSESNLDEALKRITRDACRLMKTKICSLMLLSQDGTELTLQACHGASEDYLRKPNLRASESLVGVVVRRKRPLSVLNVREHQKYRHTEVARSEGLVSMLAVPLIYSDDVLGVLVVYTAHLHRFSNSEIKVLTALADLSAVAIARAQLLARIVDMEHKLRSSERLSALGLLAAEIAHEIRNPLTVMQMLFHSLASSVPLDEAGRRDAEVIADKMKQMNRIVDQTLTFARSSEPVKELVQPTRLFEDISLLVRHKLREHKIDMRVQLAPGTPAFRADRAQIEQALLNLVLNATDAMPQGGQLRLSAFRETREGLDYIQLAVRDSGQGMTREQTDKIFAPFLTYKQSGTGIGLALVLKIVENHQGRMEVDSKPGRGTTFRLLFPLTQN
jgi:signal transduction histidine kinase